MKEDGVTIPLVKVDATVEGDLAKEHGVNGYPTLKYFVGGKPSDYDGPREAKGIVQWVKTMSGPAVVRDEGPKETDTFYVALHGAEEPEWYESVAKANRKKATWYYVKADKEEVVLKHVGEDAIVVDDATQDGVEKALKDNGFPKFGELTGDTFSSYVERGNGMVWALLEMTKDDVADVVKENREMYTEIAS